ncbi:spore germination protein [Lederbergia wuyishanensis]|uniref:Spore germination protein PF n=1 Tax=Lederbergia wuyishanensis TaxID=1347903 RepID=A0ABU0CYW9_9BACI|nr:spore germination protein [Lederbergia wuyishanensis]MCJ8005971.1 spore germination protein [Lederbergia wuyishanensis]MDQ0341336.1 spore germination protein PF [Lederbergia wuyishanensis]
MPAIVGPVQIVNVGGGVVHFGDSAVISPKSASKTSEGSGSGNTGGFIITLNGASVNPTVDSNLVDQPTIGNN